MKIAITGGTGFIGNHIINHLLDCKYELLVTGTNIEKAKSFKWFNNVEFIELDINCIKSDLSLHKFASCEKLIHLAWSGLPNYKDLFHFEDNLMSQYFFIKKIIQLGLKDITITGTCFEYGMKNGGLKPNMQTDPQNPYALAKDTLRKFLEILKTKEDFQLKWVRLFYMYGDGQSKHSILSQLDKALENGDDTFNMSGGEQLRDYLPVDDVAKKIIAIALMSNVSNTFNCSSGKPISIRKLVENHLKVKEKEISLNLGYYPYSDLEPFAFWGD